MSTPDVSDPSLAEAFEDVRNDKTPANWVLYGYVPKSTAIKIDARGEGTSLADMTDNMSDGKIHYGFFRFNVNGVFKFVYIAWCGEGVIGMQKGIFNSHAVFMSKFLHGYHVQINGRTDADLVEQAILDKLKTATSSHGRRNVKAREQAAESSPQRSTADAATNTGSQRAVNKEDSDAYWTKVRSEDEEEKKRRESATAPRGVSVGAGAGASNLKGRFENAGQQQTPQSKPPPARGPPVRNFPPASGGSNNSAPKAQPPPVRSAPPPVQNTPPPVPEPEPEPEPYAEPVPEPAPYQEPEPVPEAAPEAPADEWNETPAPEEPPQEDYSYNEAPPAQEEASAGGAGQCRALYDYDAANDGDLNFHAGDVINVLDNSDPSGWWQGELNGVTGYFPSNFVEAI